MSDDKGSALGDELIASLREGMEILAGKVEPSRFYPARADVDVKGIRQGLGLSQTQFARRFGFSAGAVRGWEQGLRQPEAAARILLLVIARNPGVVDEVLAEGVPVAA